MGQQTTFKPGALDSNTVNLSTGTVSFPLPLASLPGRNGLEFDLSIHYNNTGLRETVATWTKEAPTGLLGLGWSLPQEQIVRIWNGNTQQSTYGLFAKNTFYALVKGGIDTDGEVYESTHYQFWKIRYLPERELWAITREDGTCYFYGGNVQQAQGGMNSSAGNSIEWGVRWDTWTGPSNVAENQEQFPVAWNLASITNIWGDRVTFLYEQDRQLVGTAGTARKNYTQACRLSQVIGASGESMLLHYGPDEGTTNPYEPRTKAHTLPAGGPDAYQDRWEYHFLDSLKVLNEHGDMLSHVQLRYASLGSGEMQKQILKSFTRSNNQGHPYEPPSLFAYYGETSVDGVSVSKTDTSNVAHENALFGALKSITAPQGATTSYQYTELTIPNAHRDLEIPRPGNAWHQPLTYLGLDYVMVIWRGTGTKEHRIHVSAYQWLGRWVANTIGELPVGDAGNLQVEIASTFFALITPGQVQTVHLFHKHPYSHGAWRSFSRKIGTLTDCLVASGDDFFAILDRSNGELSCLTYNTRTNVNQWEENSPVFKEPLKTGENTMFALTAGQNYICTVSGVPNQAFQPEIRLYALDTLGQWRSPILYTSEHFISTKEGFLTFDTLSLQSGTTFVSLLLSGNVNVRFRGYQLFALRWTEKAIDAARLPVSETFMDYDEAQVAVVNDMIIITTRQTKFVYQYNSERWLTRVFDNDSQQNNYLGPNSFSTTQDGQAQYWEFNPHTEQWETGKIPPYKDGNPTLWEKFWSIVWPAFSFTVGILTLPLSFGTGLLIDLALLPFDLYALLLTPGAGNGGHSNERFFTADNRVYHQDATGTWSPIGELLTEAEKAQKPVPGADTTFETQELQFQNTQAASTFIAYAITRDRQKVLKGGSSVHTKTYISKIQLLKNGTFLSPSTTLPEQEALQRSPDDDTSLVGWDTFLTFQGGKTLHEATSLKLHRVIQGGFQGAIKDNVVSRVSVHDGYEETHTHYDYDTTSAACVPTGTTALYNKVTTIYSGASPTSTRNNGYTEAYFYAGDITSLPNQPVGQISQDNANAPALVAGRLYATRVFDRTGHQVAATTYSWLAHQRPLLGRGRGCSFFQIKEEHENDGSKQVVEQDYALRGYDGFPAMTSTANYDVTGNKETIGIRYSYGPDLYPPLKERHILAPVVQTSTHVNGTTTALQATTWLPAPGLPFRLTSGQGLPPQLQGNGWSVPEAGSVSVTVPFPPGNASTRWEPEIPPLTLTSPVSGTLLCTYNCDLHVQNGWATATLEVLVDGKKVWEATKTATQISEALPPIEIQSNQRIEWRVTNCVMEVSRDEQDHHSNQNASVVASVRDIRMQGLQFLAPAATYQAKKHMAYQARPEHAPLDWLKTAEVVARHPVYGIVTETRDVNALISSTIYDTNYRFPVAHFVHASVKNHEAGYYGFEDYENKEGWLLTGTFDGDLSSHSGQQAFSGSNVRIEPSAFTPRSATTPYVVSAWVKTRAGGNGAYIGFGNSATRVAPGNDWQYVECITRAPDMQQKPFASCDGTIDDFRFGPVDAPFSATVYDPTYHFVTAQLGTNGETGRLLYDDLQTLIATTGLGGQEISHLMTETHSRAGENPFNAARPNQKLSILPRNGGRYYRTLADYPGYKEPHADYAGGPITFVSQRVAFSTAHSGFKLRVSASRVRRSQSFFAMAFGDRTVRCDAEHTIKLTSTMPKAYPGKVLKSFTPGYDPLDGAEWMLIMLEKQALFFLNGEFLFSEPFDPSTYPLVLLWGPDEANIAGDNVFLFSDPIIELQYTDGLDRVIQTVHLDQHAEGTIANQILYDGWGHPAITTKPLHLPEISLAYQQELVKTFDWNSGKMTGKIVDYYTQANIQAPDQKADDAFYPYSRQVAEANPLARISEVSGPGVDFKAGSSQSLLTDFGRTAEANALLTDLHLTEKAASYTLLTTRHPFNGHTRVATTQLFDLQGNLIALRRSTGETALTSTRHVAYASNGTRVVTARQPNFYTQRAGQENDPYTATTDSDFLGRIQVSHDSDTNAQHHIYDPAGRLCFKMDTEGANQYPHHILCWRYDALGRILEEGTLDQQWNWERFQQIADGIVPWTATNANWTRSYIYDMARNSVTTNLKGRLVETTTRGGGIIRESFAYDLTGNTVETVLGIEIGETPITGSRMITRYEYDQHGQVTKIIYPYDANGQPDFVVHYFYHPDGQLASIGTADDPTRYAAYTYNLDGSIKTEKLNKQRLQYDHSYDFQGHLLSLQERQGLFAENLRYRDTSGTFKDGNVVATTFTGSALSNPHGYIYQYDAFGQLTSAQTVATNADMVPHPEWDLQDVAYDANGNLLHLRQGQTSATYQYAPGTNRLTGLLHPSTDQRPFGFEPGELRSHFHINSEPEIFGDWYAKGHGGGITTKEYHSGTQSYQLVAQHVLLSKIQVTPEAKGYQCSGWVKMEGPHQEIGIQMKASLNGPVLAEQRVPATDDRWHFFQCQLPDAGTATELFVVLLQTQLAQPALPVYIDDITFGPLAQDLYEHNANGWLTKSGKIDEIRYDPQTALPVDIRLGEQHTHLRYGRRRQRVVKTTTTSEPNAPQQQCVYVHGANAYPLVEYTHTGKTFSIYGPGGLLAQSSDTQACAFFLKDHLGSTRVVVNEENQPIATFNYLPFGSLMPDNSSSLEAAQHFHYLFTGQEYDQEIGLHNYRARMYGSDLGRFLTPDPKRQLPSPYVYVNNNPVNLIDPTGEMFLAMRMRGLRAARTSRGFNAARALHTRIAKNRRIFEFESIQEAVDKLGELKINYITKEVPLIQEAFRKAPLLTDAQLQNLEKVVPLTQERFNANSQLFKHHANPEGIGQGKQYPNTTDILYSATTQPLDKQVMRGTYSWKMPNGGIEIIAVENDVNREFFASLPKAGGVPKEVQIRNNYQDAVIGYIPNSAIFKQ